LAFNRGLISNGEEWMNMIVSRSKTSHTYNEDTANEIAEAILNRYYDMFKDLHSTMEEIIKSQGNLFSPEV